MTKKKGEEVVRKKSGGARLGAGKPPDPNKRGGITPVGLSFEERMIAMALGGGKIVAGIRRALQIAAEKEGITAKPESSDPGGGQ